MTHYKQKLFYRFAITFTLFVGIVVAIQLTREKRFRTDELRGRLQAYAEMSEGYLRKTNDTLALSKILPPEIRFTLISRTGKVLFDNVASEYSKLENHLERTEVQAARINGSGFSIRQSRSVHMEYLYFAYLTENQNYIRLALPYHVTFKDAVNRENLLLYVLTIVLILILIILFYKTDKFDTTISELKKFALDVKSGNVDYKSINFPDSDSGEIGKKIITLYQDLETSKHETEIERERNQIMKKELTDNIAHELKTPISSVLGYLESLNENPDISVEKQQYFIERAYVQAMRLSSLVNDIAIITKLGESSKLFVKEKVDISETVNEAFNDLELEILKSNAHIANTLPKQLFTSGNKSLLYAIFRNLIENALAYAGHNITIGIDLLNPDDEQFYHFSFYDTGYGITDKDINKIFDRFVRLDESRDRRTGGSGLGLSIVKHAVLFHGGTISVQNRDGGGLQFLFSIKR